MTSIYKIEITNKYNVGKEAEYNESKVRIECVEKDKQYRQIQAAGSRRLRINKYEIGEIKVDKDLTHLIQLRAYATAETVDQVTLDLRKTMGDMLRIRSTAVDQMYHEYKRRGSHAKVIGD